MTRSIEEFRTEFGEWPTSETEWCEWFQILDAQWGTDSKSPLHHDNRCQAASHVS